jgi:hypothetical protein
MAKATTKGKARVQPEKPKKLLTSNDASRAVLARIGKPHKKAVSRPSLCYTIFLINVKKKEQKKFFKDFLARLEARDEKLGKTDLQVSSASQSVLIEAKHLFYTEGIRGCYKLRV